MNIENIIRTFKLYSGLEDTVGCLPLINTAAADVAGLLKPDADQTDERLDRLAASIAYYNYMLIEAPRDLITYTNSGSAAYASKNIKEKTACAKALMENCLSAAGELIELKTFSFYSV